MATEIGNSSKILNQKWFLISTLSTNDVIFDACSKRNNKAYQIKNLLMNQFLNKMRIIGTNEKILKMSSEKMLQVELVLNLKKFGFIVILSKKRGRHKDSTTTTSCGRCGERPLPP